MSDFWLGTGEPTKRKASGRSALTFNEEVKLDLQYIEEWSIWMDLWILWRTAFAVLWRDTYGHGPVASLVITSDQSRGNHQTHHFCRASTSERHTDLPPLRLSDNEKRLLLYLRELWFDYRLQLSTGWAPSLVIDRACQ